MVNYYANDSRVTGILGDIWTILSEHLNFTYDSSFQSFKFSEFLRMLAIEILYQNLTD